MNQNAIIIGLVAFAVLAAGVAFYVFFRTPAAENENGGGGAAVGEPAPSDAPETDSGATADEKASMGENADATGAADSGSVTQVEGEVAERGPSAREISGTGDAKYSIPLGEIRGGGPAKDGIPAIDDPKFNTVEKADFYMEVEDLGIGIEHKGEARFYPFSILVWHEIANDKIQGTPLLVTYCPLCQTGIVFLREVDGKETEFGVSGMLWQSNLLMYNRAPETSAEAGWTEELREAGLARLPGHFNKGESLWSQVLGEAVVGEHTGKRLAIVPSDVVRYGDWKKAHPETMVLSRSTGYARNYEHDPYGDYYSSDRVIFNVAHEDARLHPKAFVLGIELNGKHKAYEPDDLPVGVTKDTFAGETITIEKTAAGEVRLFREGSSEPMPVVSGFWFSWVAVHPETKLHEPPEQSQD